MKMGMMTQGSLDISQRLALRLFWNLVSPYWKVFVRDFGNAGDAA